MMHIFRKTVTLLSLTACALFSCSDKAFFNESEHAWCYPRAFVSDKDSAALSTADTSGLLKTLSVPAGAPVLFIGFVTNPLQMMQLEARWSLGDGAVAVDTIDSSFIVKHVFADTGLYIASFSISDGMGNSLYDIVQVTVIAR